MDIAPPLIQLYSLLQSDSPPSPVEISAAVKGALMQWGRAFSSFTEKRRLNILSSIFPGSVHLLDDKKAFKWKQTAKNLFGKHFIGAMVESANTDQSIASLHPKKTAQKWSYQSRSKTNQNSNRSASNRGGARGSRGSRGAGGARGGFNRGRGGQNKAIILNLFLLPLVPIPSPTLWWAAG